jgi:hypothetical protein
MAAPPGAMADPSAPVGFDLTTPPADFDLSTPAFGLTRQASEAAPPPVKAALPDFEAAPPDIEAAPPGFEAAPPAPEAPTTMPEATAAEAPTTASEAPPSEASPTRQSLGFAAAPVPADYAVLPADPGPETAVAADPSYIWDLAATDVFPADPEGAVPQDEAPEAGQS